MAGGSRPKGRASGSRSRKGAGTVAEKAKKTDKADKADTGKADERTDGDGHGADAAGGTPGSVEAQKPPEPTNSRRRQSATLRAVASDAPRSTSSPPSPGRVGVPRIGFVAALAAALALATLLLAYQYQRASELGAQVEGLRNALETARGEIGIYHERMALVKGHVDDLSARIGALAELVTDDPSGGSSARSEIDEPSE